MIKAIIRFFDKLEDHVRIRLSHYPILYAFVGGIGIVLFWKGVWESAELYPILFGPVSILLGVCILLVTGLLVSFFIGDSIILSGFRREKKLAEKTETEVRSEKDVMRDMALEIKAIDTKLDVLEEIVEKKI